MLENNLNPCITEPTRIVDTSKPSLIDNIFVNNINNTTSGNILEKISYASLILSYLNQKILTTKKITLRQET